jgi:hypothetical protein
MDDAMEKAAHITLTALCSQNLAATAGTAISLYPIQDHSDPKWKARMDEVDNVFQVHYHSGWAYMDGYAPAPVSAVARHSAHHCGAAVSSCWLCHGSQGPHPGDQSQGPGEWCRAAVGQGLGELPS